MEILMQGLPPGFTDRSLRTQLQPFMENLSIIAYNCSLHRKRTSGTINFFHKSDGEKFLKRHGAPQVSKKQAQTKNDEKSDISTTNPETLVLMGASIHCRRGNRKPSELILQTIQLEMGKGKEDRRTEVPRASKPGRKPKALLALELGCGHIAFPDDRGFTFVAEWTHRHQFTAKFTKRNLTLHLQLKTQPVTSVHVRIPLNTVHELVWYEKGRVALVLTEPPVLIRAPDNNYSSGVFGRLSQRGEDSKKLRILGIDDAHCQVSGWCLVYYLSIPEVTVGRHGESAFLSEIERVRKEGVLQHITQSEIGYEVVGPRDRHFLNCARALENELQEIDRQRLLPFTILFLLKGLISNHHLHPAIVNELAKHLVSDFNAAKKAGRPPPISADALRTLYRTIERPSPYSDPSQFTALSVMRRLREIEASRLVNPAAQLTLSASQPYIPVFRAAVTPTRIILHGPDMEPPNRVLRKYAQWTEFFMRVQFCDESGCDLGFDQNVSLDAIYARFREVLGNGIGVAGRRYAFLGFSHSSLRSHSVWFSAPFIYEPKHGVRELHFAQRIIRNLGNFDDIMSPARRAARIGQAFSETPYSIRLDDHNIRVVEIPDVERNGRTFSDGVGRLSREAVEAIYNVLPADKQNPTVFQIRWAGAKGMLSLDTRLNGRVMHVRKSMLKFKSPDNRDLEICDLASRPIRMFLNRSMVKVLEDLGAPEHWFVNLLAKELERLRLVARKVLHTAAFLENQGIGDGVKLGGFLRHLWRLGFDYRKEDFLRRVVEAAVLRELRSLKRKTRIPVPMGVTLFGVMDETGFLKEGEVYVTYNPVRGKHSKPPGAVPVLVTRSPALHPGDIQLARNKIPPAGNPLRVHRNCIFFSQFGERDLPSQLSGGDLDGDLFNIIWDPEVVNSVSTYPPADYDRVDPQVVDEEITLKHIANFFIDFMKNDNLGVIATRHLILADRNQFGTKDPTCLKLAELHSNAVDFSKTGIAVDPRQISKVGKARPDFMARGAWVKVHSQSKIELDELVIEEDEPEDVEGPRYTYYRSEKVLGKLYRAVDERRIWDKNMDWNGRGKDPNFWVKLATALQSAACQVGIKYLDWSRKRDEAARLRLTTPYQNSCSAGQTILPVHYQNWKYF